MTSTVLAGASAATDERAATNCVAADDKRAGTTEAERALLRSVAGVAARCFRADASLVRLALLFATGGMGRTAEQYIAAQRVTAVADERPDDVRRATGDCAFDAAAAAYDVASHAAQPIVPSAPLSPTLVFAAGVSTTSCDRTAASAARLLPSVRAGGGFSNSHPYAAVVPGDVVEQAGAVAGVIAVKGASDVTAEQADTERVANCAVAHSKLVGPTGGKCINAGHAEVRHTAKPTASTFGHDDPTNLVVECAVAGHAENGAAETIAAAVGCNVNQATDAECAAHKSSAAVAERTISEVSAADAERIALRTSVVVAERATCGASAAVA
eukprot:7386227-Prymnesium_polylepis.1